MYFEYLPTTSNPTPTRVGRRAACFLCTPRCVVFVGPGSRRTPSLWGSLVRTPKQHAQPVITFRGECLHAPFPHWYEVIPYRPRESDRQVREGLCATRENNIGGPGDDLFGAVAHRLISWWDNIDNGMKGGRGKGHSIGNIRSGIAIIGCGWLQGPCSRAWCMYWFLSLLLESAQKKHDRPDTKHYFDPPPATLEKEGTPPQPKT